MVHKLTKKAYWPYKYEQKAEDGKNWKHAFEFGWSFEMWQVGLTDYNCEAHKLHWSNVRRVWLLFTYPRTTAVTTPSADNVSCWKQIEAARTFGCCLFHLFCLLLLLIYFNNYCGILLWTFICYKLLKLFVFVHLFI